MSVSAVVAADDVRGAFGFELSTNISNYERFHLRGTSNDEFDGMNGEQWRLHQSREPLRRYYDVEFDGVPGTFPIVDEGIVSAYEGWIATIIAKSDIFDSFSECQDELEEFSLVLRERYGEPLDFEEPSWWSQDKEFPTFKHHTVIGISGIWEVGNTIILTGCNSQKGDGTKFSLIYESALWQKAVSDWRSLMDEQRQLEKEKSQPSF